MSSFFVSSVEHRDRYRVELLRDAEPAADGIEHAGGGTRSILPWSVIERAFTAEVGEPEGVRTIVFDLIVGQDDGGYQVRRMDAEPGEDAMKLARILGDRLGSERATASIKSVATDGIASRWYPDLDSFELDAMDSLDADCS